MLPEAGQKFGPYEILAMLGGGGMGVVFRAWDERLHREVAVKLLHDEYQAPGMRQRFLLEARAASALTHPHICTIFDMGEQDGEPYLVMELLEGETLRERLRQSVCSAEEIVRYSYEIADALTAAHAKGIVHRDIKPANIFLRGKPNGESQVKVLDFGLAKVSMALRSGRDSRSLELTSAGTTVGTLAYMSPEQARGESLDPRSDLFSLGIVMYEMATRRVPFRGATTALAFQALLTAAPEPIRTWNITVPRELERVITRLLTKDRSERFGSAREVTEELRKLITRDEGDWLRKLPRANVPLVPAEDPVARRQRVPRAKPPLAEIAPPWSRATEQAARAGELTASDPHFIRPKRLPQRESRPRDISVSLSPSAERIAAAADAEAVSPIAPLQTEMSYSSNDESRVEDGPAVSVKHRFRPESPGDVTRDTALQIDARETEPQGSDPLVTNVEKSEVAPNQMSMPLAASVATTVEITQAAGEPAEGQGPALVVESTAPARESIEGARAPSSRRTDADPLRDRRDSGADGRIADPASARRTVASHRARGSGTEQTSAGVFASEAGSNPATGRRTKLRTWLIAAAVLVLVLTGVAVYFLKSGSFGQVVLAPSDTILLAPIMNRTGDPVLDRVVAEGLEIELQQRSGLHWLGVDALRAGMHRIAVDDHVPLAAVTPRAAAQKIGARLYTYGELSYGGSGYVLRVDLIEATSNDRLGSVSEDAPQKAELADAITRLSMALRTKLGETELIAKQQPEMPLAQQATSNMAALDLFAAGESARADGDLIGAAELYEKALTLAPDFPLAELRLAWIYDEEGAEIAAAEGASRALASANRAGDRVTPLARIAAETLTDQEPARAIATVRQLIATRPHDAEALVTMAHLMRREGHMTEALLTAEEAMRLHPFDGRAYEEASLALLGLERDKEALAVGLKAAEHGVRCTCGAEMIRYLSGQPLGETKAAEGDLAALRQRALLLDDAGLFPAGLEVWRAGVSVATGQASLASAAPAMLAQAAADRAMAGHCTEALPLAQEAELRAYGREAAFHIALTAALCSTAGENSAAEARLGSNARLHSLALERMLPMVRAAKAIRTKQPQVAVAELSRLSQERDQSPLIVYLRGLALRASGDEALAGNELRSAAEHHGYALLSRSTVAPLAQTELAARNH